MATFDTNKHYTNDLQQQQLQISHGRAFLGTAQGTTDRANAVGIEYTQGFRISKSETGQVLSGSFVTLKSLDVLDPDFNVIALPTASTDKIIGFVNFSTLAHKNVPLDEMQQFYKGEKVTLIKRGEAMAFYSNVNNLEIGQNLYIDLDNATSWRKGYLTNIAGTNNIKIGVCKNKSSATFTKSLPINLTTGLHDTTQPLIDMYYALVDINFS